MKALVTGASGFVGRNLVAALHRHTGITKTYLVDLGSSEQELDLALADSDIVFHLAGVNRPSEPSDFQLINGDLTKHICTRLSQMGRSPTLVLASSTQAELDNPYGLSKRFAEGIFEQYAADGKATAIVYRFKNLFGKWCRPNYNSVTATFCHNIAHNLPITISEHSRKIDLTYIDDVVAALLLELSHQGPGGYTLRPPLDSVEVTLGGLAKLIYSFKEHRETLVLPDYAPRFVRALYATFLSYLEPNEFAYSLNARSDQRGSLAEFLKQPSFGQLFVSRTKPGITRGNHFHDTKTEKFFVVQGEAVVRFRHIEGTNIHEFRVSGEEYRVIDIPPGYTHSIENVGSTELVTLFWASEQFNPDAPDTYALQVIE